MNKLPTINIKGKAYVMVKDRILEFNEKYPEGQIATEVIKDDSVLRFRAKVTPDVKNPNRCFIGHSESIRPKDAKYFSTAQMIETIETSAVGRALAMMGIGVIDSVASADEMAKLPPQKEIEKTLAEEKKKSDKRTDKEMREENSIPF